MLKNTLVVNIIVAICYHDIKSLSYQKCCALFKKKRQRNIPLAARNNFNTVENGVKARKIFEYILFRLLLEIERPTHNPGAIQNCPLSLDLSSLF